MKESSPGYPDSSPIEKQAAKWIARLDRGLTSEEQDTYIEWLTEDERHRQAMASYQWAWGEIDRLAGVQTIHREKIDPDVLAPSTKIKPEFKTPRKLITWFATVPIAAVLVLTLLYFVWPGSEQPKSEFEPAIELMARIEQQSLEDGSRVYINRGSSVEVAYTSDQRRVYLAKGEASFEVAKDSSRPFIVNVAGVDVRAVGTIFSVKLSDDSVDVIVTEGKVNVKPLASVFSTEKPVVDTFLEIGQRAKVRLDSEYPTVEIVTLSKPEIEDATRWQPRLLDFESTPLREIVDEFNERNPIQVTLGDPALETFLISSTFWSDNVEGFVRLMESTFGVKAEWESDRKIVLGNHDSASDQYLIFVTFRRPLICSFVLAVSVLIVLAACSSKKQSVLNIPGGEASHTLKEFAKQAEVEIMFNPNTVYGVRTNTVIGEYYPQSALRIMLKNTVLTIDFDEETGAYGVMRDEL